MPAKTLVITIEKIHGTTLCMFVKQLRVWEGMDTSNVLPRRGFGKGWTQVMYYPAVGLGRDGHK